MKKKGRGKKKIKSINGDKIKDGIDTNRDITSNFMTVSFKINKMTELLEKISNYQLTQGINENLTDPIIIIRNWVNSLKSSQELNIKTRNF